ncbi:MAG: preprotein translocase subunit SecY [Bacillota bacterium]
MLSTLKNAWKIPDLRKKLLYTLWIIVIFRLGAAIPVPGIDKAKLAQMFAESGEGLIGFFNLMSGGSFKNFTIFALGISPYITASIIMNLLQIAIPALEELSKQGEEGKKKMAQYTRYGTVTLALIQAFGFSFGIFRSAFVNPGMKSIAVSVITLTAGVAFLMYLGEKITENGIGNGISLFIFAGIISRIPGGIISTFMKIQTGDINLLSVVLFAAIAVAVVVGVIFIQEGKRKIPVQYAKRVIGRKMYGGQSTHIPLKVNQSGVIPVIFAMSLLMFPITISQFWPQSGFYYFAKNYLNSTSVLYNVLYAILIMFFAYFYTSVTFNPVEVAKNMKKNGGYIPGIRPGRPTSEYLSKTLNRLTLAGAVFLAGIAILPNIILALGTLQIRFGGTALLIAVGVSLETTKQIEAQMMMRHRKGFLND